MVLVARPIDILYAKLGDKVKENVSLAPYTSARIGGPADILITAESADELARTIKLLRKEEIEYLLLGGGSNVLVSDKGIRGVVVLNRAKGVRFHNGDEPFVTAESGVIFSNLANRCASKGFSGLEWAATVPGTIGGVNNGEFYELVANTLTSDGLDPQATPAPPAVVLFGIGMVGLAGFRRLRRKTEAVAVA